MSRTLHWTLLGGCAGLISLFTPLAWNSLQVFRLAGPTPGLEAQAAVENAPTEEQEVALSVTPDSPRGSGDRP